MMTHPVPHAYVTHRGHRQWGVMVYDRTRRIWREPMTWYRTREQAREDLREHACNDCDRETTHA